MTNNKELFSGIDYGTRVTTSAYDKVEVKVDPKFMVGDFGLAYARDCERRNPLKFAKLMVNLPSDVTSRKSLPKEQDPSQVKQMNLDSKLISMYFEQIIRFRIKSVNDETIPWRQMKQLVMPAWIQFVISMVGKFYDKDNGLLFIPTLSGEDVLTIDEMLQISLTIESFTTDGKHFFKDAFPREKEGDKDVMSMAILKNVVTGSTSVGAPIMSYVTGFLGMKLAEEASYKARYRIQYDDVEFVRSMLMNDGRILE